MTMPGRSYQATTSSSYRFSFNGQEKSDEIFEGSTTALFWEYDSRTGRRWNVDPVDNEEESPYLCFNGNPILNVDTDGDSPEDPIERSSENEVDTDEGEIDDYEDDNGYTIYRDGTVVKTSDLGGEKTDYITYSGYLHVPGSPFVDNTYNSAYTGLAPVIIENPFYSSYDGYSAHQYTPYKRTGAGSWESTGPTQYIKAKGEAGLVYVDPTSLIPAKATIKLGWKGIVTLGKLVIKKEVKENVKK